MATNDRMQDDWTLLINTPVEIRHQGAVLRSGIVDDAMPDSSILWIAGDGQSPRQMFESALGHEVWINARELSGGARFQMTTDRLSPQKETRGWWA